MKNSHFVTLALASSMVLAFCNNLHAQEKQLDKAVRQGFISNSWEYQASFKNLKWEKKTVIESWCRINGYAIQKFDKIAKDRFGAGVAYFISSVRFRNIEDDCFARKCKSLSGCYGYLEAYPLGRHRKEALQNVVDYASSISECANSATKFPAVSVTLHDKAYKQVILESTTSQYLQFLKHFEHSQHTEGIKLRLCSEAHSFEACLSYAKLYPELKNCLAQTAASFVRRSKNYSDCIDYLKYFCSNEIDASNINGNEIWSILHGLINSLEKCEELLNIFPHRKTSILQKSKEIAKSGDFDVKREYLRRFPHSGEYEYFNLLVQKEDVRLESEQIENYRIRQENERKRKEKELEDQRAAQVKSRASTLANRKAIGNKPKFNFGNRVRSIDLGGKDSHWQGVVVDRRETIYQIEIDAMTIRGSWYQVYLNRSTCTGNKRLSHDDEYGTKIWIPEHCIK